MDHGPVHPFVLRKFFADLRFMPFRKLGIKVGFFQMIHYKMDPSFFPQPQIKFRMAKPDTECVDAGKPL
jgi:hypothetical protein